MNALYRPGPMENIPEFIERKHGRHPITYDIPEMEKYLSDTYGITVYQEQVMIDSVFSPRKSIFMRPVLSITLPSYCVTRMRSPFLSW